MIPDRFAPVIDELAPLAQRFESAGHRLYLVGGTVRDLLFDAVDALDDAQVPVEDVAIVVVFDLHDFVATAEHALAALDLSLPAPFWIKALL